MSIAATIRSVFSHFQNLNLLALMNDLRENKAAHADWASGKLLCPVAHGMASGRQVHDLNMIGEFVNLQRACAQAARFLGASPADIARFVRSWDDQSLSAMVLLGHLEEIWAERLADAVAVQEVLAGRCVLEELGGENSLASVQA